MERASSALSILDEQKYSIFNCYLYYNLFLGLFNPDRCVFLLKICNILKKIVNFYYVLFLFNCEVKNRGLPCLKNYLVYLVKAQKN